MTDLEKDTVKAFAKYNEMDPLEVAWHKEEYTQNTVYQLLGIGVGLKRAANEIVDEIKEAFRGDKQ